MSAMEIDSVIGVKRNQTQLSRLQQKVFVRSNRGKATKVVREHYLRNDIPCSSQLCLRCQQTAPPDAKGRIRHAVLAATPSSTKSLGPHYLVPDTNIFFHCMDLMERTDAIFDVIVLQTVLDELRNRSTPLYNRLRQLCLDGDKRFYVFHNEFREETYVIRDAGETINDRNDRAVRVACAWYKKHLQEAVRGSGTKVPEVVMLTNDRGNREKAKAEGVVNSSVNDYVSGLSNADELLDMISAAFDEENQVTKKGENIYPEYLSAARLLEGVKSMKYHQGVFNVSPYNYLEGSVPVPAFDRPLKVIGREHINRAIQGDVVVVEMLPESEWYTPVAKIIEDEEVNKNEGADNDDEKEGVVSEQERKELEDEKAKGVRKEIKPEPTAKVVGVIKRKWRSYVGHIDPSSVSASKKGRGQQTVFVLPMDKRIPKIRIRTRQATNLQGQRIVVSIDAWERTSRYPEGHFVRALGEIESKGAETEAILLEYNVQYRPFPKAVLDCLPKEGHDWVVPAKEDLRWKDRKDFRDMLVCSIDPPGCQDIDDALHAKLLPNGNYQVGVHIADVTHFVKPDTPMDDEAASRGTTVYLVDKRIDMLPHLLGTDLCSLKPYVERFAFSTIWEVTPEADIVNVEFTKSVIKSKESFSYEQAQMRINDESQQDDLTKGMRILLALSKKLKQKRMNAGALNLASPEVKVQVESETSDPAEVEVKQLFETNSLVEEFMLLANISVADKIYEKFPESAMLRRHGAPPATNFEVLQDMLKTKKNMSLDVSSSKAVADSLDRCTDPKEPYFNTLLRIMATRCMLAAEYFGSGQFAESEFRHYGLATHIYTHFTSPIRRYADVMVHRQLAAAIGYEEPHPSLVDKVKLEDICSNINFRHRNAQFAGRASVEYYVGQALKNKVAEVDAFVMKVFKNGFAVFIAQFGIESLIYVRDLAKPEPETEFVPEEYSLAIERKSKQPYKVSVFDKIKVRVKVVKEENTGKQKVSMELVDY
ncbi:RNB-domain-containing protein [Saitoella complicata NRRL Y-17804]|uniref:Ribosomal RNA-processing protein 44 n=1 Tax=Saitoella complicata (strain BCRC 22490 / CBS 7301 / JCM 7358 / NBRC 10748 / NRRL Y-17804) TaxID=698492 RepID=A0A0E9NI21_SAICN|nr:RNB-domain-containing protein [Saitoella complicata NRRL Y-17804]ODQ56001.1 RNB-domain-containing protein [Saitoella complicata NRRL Y-17804]GAO49346.1 hypothetical protein G7K_3497-t1 [Saitoella complicata NRRL Y-17804]